MIKINNAETTVAMEMISVRLNVIMYNSRSLVMIVVAEVSAGDVNINIYFLRWSDIHQSTFQSVQLYL